MKTRRNVLTTLGAALALVPATALAETKPSYEVSCGSTIGFGREPKLWGTKTCHTEAEALNFVNECYAKWAEYVKTRYEETCGWKCPDRFKPFASLADDQLFDCWGFQGFVNKTTPV